MNDTVDPRTGVHRVRKKKNKVEKEDDEGDVDYSQDSGFDDPHAQYQVQGMDPAGPSRQGPYAPPYAQYVDILRCQWCEKAD